MEKFHLTIEFRYSDAPKYEGEHSQFVCKTVTIGVYDTRDNANIEGNKAMELFETKFKLHKFPNGVNAKKERFSNNGGCFGNANDLITNSAYLSTPFEFYAKITKLKYDSIEESINDIRNINKVRGIKYLCAQIANILSTQTFFTPIGNTKTFSKEIQC